MFELVPYKQIALWLALVVGVISVPPRAQALTYAVCIHGVDVAAPQTPTMTCNDNSKAMCSAQIEVVVGGRAHALTVTGLFKLGNAYFRFRAGNRDLYAAGQRSFHLSIGAVQAANATVPLSLPSPDLAQDAQSGLYHEPVMRITPDVARIEITVEPL